MYVLDSAQTCKFSHCAFFSPWEKEGFCEWCASLSLLRKFWKRLWKRQELGEGCKAWRK